MEFKIRSKYLKEFIDEITYKNRNPDQLKALELLDDIDTNPEIILYPGDVIYRSRVIKQKSKINNEPNFFGFGCKDSFIAPAENTREFRANYRYIPYLYCAKHPYTAVLEVRPRLGATVSVATIQVKEKLRILDFTLQEISKKMSPAKINLFTDLSNMYAKPVTDEDDISDYIPTQFIAEYAKRHLNYDGIAYKSSLMPELDSLKSPLNQKDDRYNVVIFNHEKCVPIKSNIVQVTNHYLDCEQTDDDKKHLNLKSIITETLESL